MENDNNQKQEPNSEIDHFSRFMFGNSKHKEAYNNPQELPEQKEQIPFQSRSNRSDDWLFGNRRNQSATTTPNQIENLLNNVDLILLMETVDMFVATTKQFSPIFKEITPFFQRFTKKFKSNKDK